MSLIKDISSELDNLDYSNKALKRFSRTVGVAFLILGIGFNLLHPSTFWYSIGGVGVFLLAAGALFTWALKPFYTAWMSLAFFLGWFTSRILLIALFYLLLFPVGLLLKVTGKDFLRLKKNKNTKSLWVAKPAAGVNYEKLY